MSNRQKAYLPIKRAIDIVLSFFAIIILSPILVLISVLIKIDSKGPVLFKQRRVGKHSVHFNIYKFRTMIIDAPSDSPTDKLDNAESWITNIGGFLRKTSLDELPQLFNIIMGDMSIVGPRPALWNQNKLNHLREKSMIHTIKPGLTGLAQIRGRDQNNDEEKVELDLLYFNQLGLKMDLYCFIGTIIPVMLSSGVESK